MQKRLFLIACTAVLILTANGLAQVPEMKPVVKVVTHPENIEQLITLARSFPRLEALTKELAGNYEALRQGESSGASERDWTTVVLRDLVLDNITLKAGFEYSKTISAKLENNAMTKFQLTEAKAAPTYEATWSLPLNKILPGAKKKDSKEALTVNRNKQLSTLLTPYGQFDQVRFVFLKGVRSDDSSQDCENFYTMKSAALALLQATGRTGDDDLVKEWATTQCLLPVRGIQTAESR